jgi:hypothetical protein
MNKLTDLRNQIDEFKRLENQRDKKMEEVKFEADEQNKIAHWFGPPLNFVARDITKLVIESELLSLLEEKDKALAYIQERAEFELDIENTNTYNLSNGLTMIRQKAYKALNTSSNNEGDM